MLPGLDCGWLLNPAAPVEGLRLSFELLDLGPDAVVRVYRGTRAREA